MNLTPIDVCAAKGDEAPKTWTPWVARGLTKRKVLGWLLWKPMPNQRTGGKEGSKHLES